MPSRIRRAPTKQKVSLTLNASRIQWIETNLVDTDMFRSLSHAMDAALELLQVAYTNPASRTVPGAQLKKVKGT